MEHLAGSAFGHHETTVTVHAAAELFKYQRLTTNTQSLEVQGVVSPFVSAPPDYPVSSPRAKKACFGL